jgi:hypothetical protein
MWELYQFRVNHRLILNRHKIKAYRLLYDFTKSQCADCAQSDCACKDTICGYVEEQAIKRGAVLQRGDHPRLRFIGCQGCTVPPHLRETCTIYLCEPAQAKPGFDRGRYERIKNLCADIELKLMMLD